MKITTSKRGRPIFIAKYVTAEDEKILFGAGFWRHELGKCGWKNDHCMACEAEVDGYYTPFPGTAHKLWAYCDERALREIACALVPPKRIEKLAV